MYSCIRDFLFGFGSPVDAVCCSSGGRTTRSEFKSVSLKVGFGGEFGGEFLPPCVLGVVPPPPLRDEDALSACGVRNSFKRLENASVPPAVGAALLRPRHLQPLKSSASRLSPSSQTVQQQRAPPYGNSPLQCAERVSQVA